jgi:hypothetical protein
MNNFDDKTAELEEALAEAKCAQEEIEECGDLEDRLEAAFEVVEAERRLSSHLLTDLQEDPTPGTDGIDQGDMKDA